MISSKHPRFGCIIYFCFIAILMVLIAWAFPAVAQQTVKDSEPDRALGGPDGVTQDLKKAEQPTSTFPTAGWAQSYYDWKKRLKDDYGLSMGLSAYYLYQRAKSGTAWKSEPPGPMTSTAPSCFGATS